MSDRHQRRSVQAKWDSLLDESPEEAESLQKPSREELQMYVIEFDNRNQAQLLGHLAHMLGVCCREIEGESEEMLALWTSAMGSILAEITEPTCKYHVRIDLTHDGSALYQILIERKEVV